MVTHFRDVYAGKRVLVTGHTGFKGGWLSLWLHELGAAVHGLALPASAGDTFFSLLPSSVFQREWMLDIRDADRLNAAIAECRPDIIFHLAAQPLVSASYKDPVGTFTANALGTAHLLQAMRQAKSPVAVVIVTSDKCYRNDNSGHAFQEDDPLGGHDIYSMSKAATELVVTAWHSSFFAKDDALGPLATARAGNVIGGGDYAEDRIVPDAVRAFARQSPLTLRNPQATRPWQHVLESVSGYLALGQRLLTQPDKTRVSSYNFGPDCEAERSVQDLMEAWLAAWPHAFSLETSPAPSFGEAAKLSLDHAHAVRELGWKPVWDFQTTVSQTAAWYRLRHEAGADHATMLNFTKEQISAYALNASRVNAAWTQ